MIRVTEFPAAEQIGLEPAEALTRSIRMHGVIQPLLVRRMGSAYQVIAGRKRLAAATDAGLDQVPCIVHDVDDDGAARLRTAESVKGEAAPDLRAVIGARLGDSISEMAADLSRLQTTLALLAGSSMPFQKTVAIDLLAAQAWRTLWSAQLASLLAAPPAADVRRRPLAAVVDDVLQHFEPECRLSRLRLSARYHGGASLEVDGAMIGFALTGAIIITMSLLDRCVEPTVEVHSHRLGDGGVWLEVVQRHCLIAKGGRGTILYSSIFGARVRRIGARRDGPCSRHRRVWRRRRADRDTRSRQRPATHVSTAVKRQRSGREPKRLHA